MATTRIMPLHVGKGRTESRAISDVDDVTDRPTFCAALADMKRHDSCGCHRSDLLSEKKTACRSRPRSFNLFDFRKYCSFTSDFVKTGC